MNEPTVLTGNGVYAFHYLAQRSAMRLELKGMKHSSGRSVIAHVKREHGFKGNRQKVYDQFETWLREQGYLR